MLTVRETAAIHLMAFYLDKGHDKETAAALSVAAAATLAAMLKKTLLDSNR